MWDRWQRRLRQDDSGMVAVLVAIALTALMGLAALGTDVGRLFLERQRLSTVADAAALAAAQLLPQAPDQAIATARDYLFKNGVNPAQAEIAVDTTRRRISVTLHGQVSMTFARIIGPSEVDIAGSATAWTTNLSGVRGAAPLAVPKDDFVLGQLVTLKTSGGSKVSSGNYQALALGGRGASMYEQNLANGYNDWIRIGDWVETEPGNMAGPTDRAVDDLIRRDPTGTYLNYSRHSSRLLTVPIVESFNVHGRSQVKVIGFGMFFLESNPAGGSKKGGVVGRFIRFIGQGEGDESAADFGAYTTKLLH